MEPFFDDSIVVRCLTCGRKNRIPKTRITETPICGFCKAKLDDLIIQCIACGTKNRVPESRFYEGPTCGRCGTPLYSANITDVTDDTFESEIRTFPGPVVLCAWRPNCMACCIILPAIQRLAPKYGGGIKVARINIENNPHMCGQYSIDETPTFLFFKSGKHHLTLAGAASEDEIERHLKELIHED